MAYATQNTAFGTAGTLGQRLGNLRLALAERLARNRTYRQTLNELAALTDRELADLGLSRADIRGIARDAAYAV